MNAQDNVLFRTQHLTVFCFSAPSDSAIITFNEMGLDAHKGEFWGEKLFKRLGVMAIGFVSASPNWYPAADMSAAIDCVLPLIATRRVITYGFSQGGYGALKYARRLGAQAAVALSPQFSIDPGVVAEFDPRFHRFFDPKKRNGEKIEAADLCPNNIVVADMLDPVERWNVENIRELGTVAVVPTPFMTHWSMRIISDARVGADLIAILNAQNGPSAPLLRSLVRRGRRNSITYSRGRMSLLLASVHRHRSLALSAAKDFSTPEECFLYQSHIHAALGQFAIAREFIQKVSDHFMLGEDILHHWTRFRESGFLDGVRRLAPLFPQRYPTKIDARLYGLEALIEAGMERHALEELLLLEEMPNASVHYRIFVRYFARLGRSDLASRFMQLTVTEQDLTPHDRAEMSYTIIRWSPKHLRAEILVRELGVLGAIAAADPAEAAGLARFCADIPALFETDAS